MTRFAKGRVNAGYAWLEQNPVTGIFLSAGISVAVTVALVGALGIYSASTFQAKTACANPASKECAEVRLEVAKAEPLRNPCASFQRVTSRRGRNCEQFYVPRGGRTPSQVQASPKLGDSGVGEVPSSGGGHAPVDPDSDHDPKPGNGGSDGAPAPGAGGDRGPTPATIPPSTPEAPPAETPATPATKAPVREAVAPVVEGVKQGACSLLSPICSALP